MSLKFLEPCYWIQKLFRVVIQVLDILRLALGTNTGCGLLPKLLQIVEVLNDGSAGESVHLGPAINKANQSSQSKTAHAVSGRLKTFASSF